VHAVPTPKNYDMFGGELHKYLILKLAAFAKALKRQLQAPNANGT